MGYASSDDWEPTKQRYVNWDAEKVNIHRSESFSIKSPNDSGGIC